MPFVSKKQRSFLYSQEPEVAKEFEAATPKNAKLPLYKAKKKKATSKKKSP